MLNTEKQLFLSESLTVLPCVSLYVGSSAVFLSVLSASNTCVPGIGSKGYKRWNEAPRFLITADGDLQPQALKLFLTLAVCSYLPRNPEICALLSESQASTANCTVVSGPKCRTGCPSSWGTPTVPGHVRKFWGLFVILSWCYLEESGWD